MNRSLISHCPKSNPAIEPLENRLYRSADLTGVFSGKTPAALVSTDRNHVAIELKNTGDSSAKGLVTVDLYAAMGSTPDDGSVLLGSVTRHVNLKPGAESAVKFRFAGPAALQDGSYSLVVQIDASAIVTAIDTNDIVVAPAPVQVKQPFVDLTAENVQGPIKPIFIDGDVVTSGPASVLVENRGTKAATGTVSVDFYLSTDSTLDGTAILSGEIAAKSVNLQPGRLEKFNDLLDPPATIAAGDYFLFAVLTPGGGIVQTPSAVEQAKAVRQVVVVRNANPKPPRKGVSIIPDAEPIASCAPAGSAIIVPCSPDDSSSCGNPPPSTAPTTCPATAPTTNCNPSSIDDSQSAGNDNSDQATPTEDSPDGTNSSDSLTSCDPQQPDPIDTNAPPADDGQGDSTESDASDPSQADTTQTDTSGDQGSQGDDSSGDDGSNFDDCGG